MIHNARQFLHALTSFLSPNHRNYPLGLPSLKPMCVRAARASNRDASMGSMVQPSTKASSISRREIRLGPCSPPEQPVERFVSGPLLLSANVELRTDGMQGLVARIAAEMAAAE